VNNRLCICPPGENVFNRGGFGRRQALRATGAGLVATLTAFLVGAGRTAHAQSLGGSVSVIDGLAVRMVTDNYTDRYSIPLATPGIKVERVGATERVGVEPVMRQVLAGYRRAGTEDHHLGPQVAAHRPRDIAQPMGGL